MYNICTLLLKLLAMMQHDVRNIVSSLGALMSFSGTEGVRVPVSCCSSGDQQMIYLFLNPQSTQSNGLCPKTKGRKEYFGGPSWR